MAKKLIEVTNEVSSKAFNCERNIDGDNKKAEIDIAIQAMIDTGISNAIPRALFLIMDAEPKEEVQLVVGPFTYGVTARKSGESLSLNPTFTLTNEKKFLAELDNFEEKLHKNVSLIESIATTIDDEVFLDTVMHCCKLDEYDVAESEWIEKKTDADRGVEFDQTSSQLFVALHISAIIHVLVNSKSPDEVVKYEVPGEGTYTIERKKDKWEFGFIPSKEFKQTIKNDRLIEALV
jgi:hypothetical protein